MSDFLDELTALQISCKKENAAAWFKTDEVKQYIRANDRSDRGKARTQHVLKKQKTCITALQEQL